MRGFDPGQGTYKCCEYKEGLSDECLCQGKQNVPHGLTYLQQKSNNDTISCNDDDENLGLSV
jgi:hypothetical protein